jgi:hypothetical protein
MPAPDDPFNGNAVPDDAVMRARAVAESTATYNARLAERQCLLRVWREMASQHTQPGVDVDAVRTLDPHGTLLMGLAPDRQHCMCELCVVVLIVFTTSRRGTPRVVDWGVLRRHAAQGGRRVGVRVDCEFDFAMLGDGAVDDDVDMHCVQVCAHNERQLQVPHRECARIACGASSTVLRSCNNSAARQYRKRSTPTPRERECTRARDHANSQCMRRPEANDAANLVQCAQCAQAVLDAMPRANVAAMSPKEMEALERATTTLTLWKVRVPPCMRHRLQCRVQREYTVWPEVLLCQLQRTSYNKARCWCASRCRA